MAKEYGLKSNDIKKLNYIMDALDICEQYGVPCEHLDTLEEIKERLWLHYALQKQGNVKKRIQDVMQRTGEEDEKKRGRLRQMFEELIQIIGSKDETKRIELVKDLLQKDNTSADLLGDCEEKMEGLKEKDCVILIAGETNAGKSSFLNLLLESEFLPTHSISCTSSITTLRYGAQKRARIIYGGSDARVEDIDSLDEAGIKKLKDITYMKGKEREEGHNVKEVQVFLPVDFLKCGIVLADTPGIGENEFLETYLMEFISENNILGFIYIIFSDSAGGVQEDRLLQLLKLVIEQQKNKHAFKFDPKAALFLANRFDAVPEDHREKVRSHILSQLEKSWPELEESMVVFFSTKHAKRDVDANPDYINGGYKILLEAISNLFSVALDRRIRTSYIWIESVLKRINHYLKTTVTRLSMTTRENQESALRQQSKLNILKERSNTVIKELIADIEECSDEITKEVQNYLSTPQAKFLLCSVWKDNEIPEVEERIVDAHHWEWIKRRIDEAFFDRLCNAIESWDDDRCKISSVEKQVVENIESKLGVLQEEISKVEYDMRSTQSSIGSNESTRLSKRLSVQLSSPTLVDIPIQLAPNLQHRVSKNPLGKMMAKKESVKFEKDPKAWAKKRAEKLMDKLLRTKLKNTDKGLLTQLVDQLMQRPRDIVMNLEIQIPSIIDANLDLLHNLEDIIINDSRYAAKYEQMMVQIEGLKETLMSYGEGYIFVNDFKSNEIKVIQETAKGQSLAQTFRFSELVTGRSTTKDQWVTAFPHGLWTIVRPGSLHREGEEKKVSIKMYMPSSGITHTFQEVAKLRCLLHADVYVAEFLGIHHTDAVTPAYIFSGHLQPLRIYVASNGGKTSQLQKLFREIADGLHYLHSKGMVHMELTSSTVTVNENGDVRLTGACVPRHATLPLDKETPVEEFVYLAPEVLTNELYITSADVYGYGLLVFEILSEVKAFCSKRKTSFNDFVKTVSPYSMLHLDTGGQSLLTKEALILIKQCIEVSENRRPNMTTVIDMLNTINGNFKKETSADWGGRRLTEMHTPREVFRKSRKCEKNNH